MVAFVLALLTAAPVHATSSAVARQHSAALQWASVVRNAGPNSPKRFQTLKTVLSSEPDLRRFSELVARYGLRPRELEFERDQDARDLESLVKMLPQRAQFEANALLAEDSRTPIASALRLQQDIEILSRAQPAFTDVFHRDSLPQRTAVDAAVRERLNALLARLHGPAPLDAARELRKTAEQADLPQAAIDSLALALGHGDPQIANIVNETLHAQRSLPRSSAALLRPYMAQENAWLRAQAEQLILAHNGNDAHAYASAHAQDSDLSDGDFKALPERPATEPAVNAWQLTSVERNVIVDEVKDAALEAIKKTDADLVGFLVVGDFAVGGRPTDKSVVNLVMIKNGGYNVPLERLPEAIQAGLDGSLAETYKVRIVGSVRAGSLGHKRFLAQSAQVLTDDWLAKQELAAPSSAGRDSEEFSTRVERALERLLPRMAPDFGPSARELAKRVSPLGRWFPAVAVATLTAGYTLFAIPPGLILAACALLWPASAPMFFNFLWISMLAIPAAAIAIYLKQNIPGETFGYLNTALKRVYLKPGMESGFQSVLAHEVTHFLYRTKHFQTDLTANAFFMLDAAQSDPARADEVSNASWWQEFDAGRSGMRALLQGEQPAQLLSKPDRPPTEEIWTYEYGAYLGGAAYEFGLGKKNPDRGWDFLRLISQGKTPAEAAKLA